ncbi:hypothetical protein ACFQU2_12830 [Siccirubricoccus deserti]
MTDEFKQYVKRSHPEIRQVMHGTPNGHPFVIAERKAFDVTAEERQALYEAAWEKGGLHPAPPSRICWPTRRPTTQPRSSCATRSARS